MSTSVIIEIVITVILAAIVSTLMLLFKKQKIGRTAAVLACAISLLVGISGILAAALYDKPDFRVLGENDMVIPVFSEYTEAGASASFRDKDLTDKIIIKGSVDTNTVGDYSIEYDFTHRGHYFYGVRRVRVVDTVAPELTLTGNTELTVSAIGHFSEPGFSATDNYNGDITASVKAEQTKTEENKYIITYTVADSSGNTAKAQRIVHIKDIVKPRLSSNKGTFINVAKGSEFILPTVTATDDLDGDITSKIQFSGSVDTANSGVYKLDYSVTDNAGNTAYMSVQVNVYMPDDPSLSRIYLTFDDGPSDNVTPRVLDILRDNNIKATFFINGYGDDKLPLIQRIINEGHTLAVHGTSHDYASVYSSVDACVNNFNSLRDKIFSQTGYTCTVMRFPGGSSNQVSKKYCAGVVSNSANQLTAQGWRYFDWNVDSGDADGKMSRSYIVNKVKRQLKTGRANVVLMHDYYTKSTTADALQEIINYGNANGYIFCPINETTPDVRHSIAN